MKMKKNKNSCDFSGGFCDNACKQCKCFAKFDAYNDSDGFTPGHYEVEVNQEQRADTENCMSKDQK